MLHPPINSGAHLFIWISLCLVGFIITLCYINARNTCKRSCADGHNDHDGDKSRSNHEPPASSNA